MELMVSQSYECSYGEQHETTRHLASKEVFLRRVTNIQSADFFVANSVVKRRWLRKPLHVLLLDCDGTGEMFGAANFLKESGIGYGLIQSSPSHYWLVVDKIGLFPDLLHFAIGIPGVDDKYLKFLDKHKSFYLRVAPLNGKMALFEGSDNLKEPLAKQWYDDFEKLWGLPEVRQRHRAEVIKAKITDGSILDSVADPEFQL